MANAEALRATLKRIEQVAAVQFAPSYVGPRWDQANWRQPVECGTAMCFAGWAVDQHPAAHWLLRPEPGTYSWDLSLAYLDADGPDHNRHAAEVAQIVLDLTDDQADALFYAHNDVEDLQALVGLILDGETDREVLRQHTGTNEHGDRMRLDEFRTYDG